MHQLPRILRTKSVQPDSQKSSAEHKQFAHELDLAVPMTSNIVNDHSLGSFRFVWCHDLATCSECAAGVNLVNCKRSTMREGRADLLNHGKG